jgi:hypothetical protein
MPSRRIEDLVPELQPQAITLIEKCRARGIEMRPSTTLRTPFEQAKLWRQSRSKAKVHAKIAQLRSLGADFLAFCLESVGPQPTGDPVTKAIPGLSWHQWGEAMDCFWLVNGDAEWSPDVKINGLKGYRVYAEEAKQMGLTAGGLWPGFKDWPHVQLKPQGSPEDLMSITDIDRIMKERFGE